MPDRDDDSFRAFDVSLVRGEGGIYWLSADCDQGALKAVPVKSPDWGVAMLHESEPLDWLNTTIRTAAGNFEDGMRIGQALTDVVFGDQQVQRLFSDLRATANSRKQQVVVRLMGAPADVSDWPWELMLDPADKTRQLVLAQDVHLVRTPRVRTYPVTTPTIAPPLNLLVIMSNPPLDGTGQDDLDQFDLYEEKRHLLRDLDPLVRAGTLHITFEDRPTMARLDQALRKTPRGFHIVHYLGHASRNGLWFENKNSTGKLVLTDEFGAFLKQSPDLKFVLFAGCETARAPKALTPDDWEGGLSITQRAVRDAAPIVMGMQVVLPFRTQRLFTRAFYEALVAGRSVVGALRLARKQVWEDQKDRVKQLDWAIPTLFLGGAKPGPVIDTTAPATPPPRQKRVRLRITPTQKDLRFVSRHANLRRVIDVLSDRTESRMVCIRGKKNVRYQDLSNLMDRAMEELDPGIAQLSFSARSLDDEHEKNLLDYLREILRQHGGSDDLGNVAPKLLRTVLIDRIISVPLAIAIEHADELPDDSAAIEIIREILNRRGSVRVALIHSSEHNPFNFGLDGLWETSVVAEMRWSEVWDWLRGQLPELARLGVDQLHPLHATLGEKLEQWEALAAHVAGRYRGPVQADIAALARSLNADAPAELAVDDMFSAPDRPASPPPMASPPRMSGADRATSVRVPPVDPFFPMETAAGPGADLPQPAPDTEDAITLAVAGPFTQGRAVQFRDAIARFADAHGLPGRVSTAPDQGAAIVARVLDVGSPFKDGQSATTADLIVWMNEVANTNAKILVLDFGITVNSASLTDFVAGLVASGMLVIVAGGNSGKPTWPAWLPYSLAVGATTGGKEAAYSPYFHDADKPDLYAPETLDDSALSGWVSQSGMRGTTFSALYVSAAAALVWASYPTLSAQEVRRILCGTATGTGPRFLDLRGALHWVRSLIICDALESNDMELYQLLSESGLPKDMAVQTIERMVLGGRIVRRVTDHGEVLSFPGRISARYDALRGTPSSDQRTRAQEKLIADAKALAQRRALTDRDTWALWRSGQLGNRIIALAGQDTAVGAYTLPIIEEGILRSQSAFEQYHALRLAQKWGATFDAPDRARIVDAITKELGADRFDSGRRTLAHKVMDHLNAM